MGGKHLILDDRNKIEALVRAKHNAKDIAEIIGCSVRTVYRELERGKCSQISWRTYDSEDSYSAYISQKEHDRLASGKGRPCKLGKDHDLAFFLSDLIGTCHYSPAAALAEIRLQGLSFTSISTTSLYRYIYGGYLSISADDLPHGRYQAKKKAHGQDRNISFLHLFDKSISERPEQANNRAFGHWEMDTVVGRRNGRNRCLLVLTERKTRYEIVRVLPSKTASAVVSALEQLRADGYPFLSVTCDNGSEFSDASGMELLAPVYFCHAYSSWERGSNENQNKLIRRFSPKGKSMNQLNEAAVSEIEYWINNYPRKMFGWQRPADLFESELSLL